MKKKIIEYFVASPDGFSIERETIHATPELAWQAFEVWKKGYERQGYYSTIKQNRRVELSLEDLKEHCTLENIVVL